MANKLYEHNPYITILLIIAIIMSVSNSDLLLATLLGLILYKMYTVYNYEPAGQTPHNNVIISPVSGTIKEVSLSDGYCHIAIISTINDSRIKVAPCNGDLDGDHINRRVDILQMKEEYNGKTITQTAKKTVRAGDYLGCTAVNTIVHLLFKTTSTDGHNVINLQSNIQKNKHINYGDKIGAFGIQCDFS